MLQNAPQFQVSLARSPHEIRAAQRLRYEVFVAELGGDGPGVNHTERLEIDDFDAHADHLLLRDMHRPDSEADGIVGVYRLMTAQHAAAAGGFYSASEFDLTALTESGLTLLELGRSCLHPDHRGGAALMPLWQGLADYVRDNQIDLLFGTASFHGTDLDAVRHPVSHLHATYLAPEHLRPYTIQPTDMTLLPPHQIDRKAAMRDTPALIKSYLKLGGTIGQGVFVDHAFNTTDVCLILETTNLSSSNIGRSPRRRL
ncbi:GNAT family N-acyltransferase [Marivita sp. XM-24bin2]|jgi:putative hemolysin|uniref:GNAT family N-acetyltransferase n=1 Tax=Marivita sp. XM-24bin2 TaxID=2133951 RepID=UPI000D7AF84E|nr:GNAT family N-acyltransferase [Marivita sp. XM-24bin2]MCR9107880.1 GNAT family N-acetyltransferase [Paracoccaceae bacterium]PWL34611.1 MAG: ornithine-acyl-ACP acyltransferase [Marivita sp. XM-24bin2]